MEIIFNLYAHITVELCASVKWFFSIVLIALEGCDYRFLFVDVSWQGLINDGGVFQNCQFYGALDRDELNLPIPTEIPPLNP